MTFSLAEALGMHAHEVEALPATEVAEWLMHFHLQAEAREKRTKPPQNQVPKKERERLARLRDVSTG